MATFKLSFQVKLIYVFRINDKAHEGVLKVGDTTTNITKIDDFNIAPNSKILKQAANERISDYTRTAGIKYELLHTEIATYQNGDDWIMFQDHEVLQYQFQKYTLVSNLIQSLT